MFGVSHKLKMISLILSICIKLFCATLLCPSLSY